MIKIDKEKCKGCEYCILECPNNVIEIDGDFNKSGVQYAKVTNADKCTSCGKCFRMCPDMAMEIT